MAHNNSSFSPKKIAILIQKLTDGGAERVASELSIMLPDHINHFILSYVDEITYPHKSHLIKLEFHRQPKSFFAMLLQWVIRWWKLKKIKKRQRFDVVISFPPKEVNLFNLLTKGKEKVIVTVHTDLSEIMRLKPGIIQRINMYIVKHFYKYADYIIASSEEVRQDLIYNFKLPEKRVVTIYNLFNLQKISELSYSQLPQRHKEYFDCPVVISIGRLVTLKGYDNLIRSFKKVIETHHKAKLIILGEGPLRNYLVELIRKLNLHENVYLLGFQDNPYMYLKNSDIFVLASKVEGFGNVIVEAMCCGTPVISTDCRSGPREIITGKCTREAKLIAAEYANYGILVPVCDIRNRKPLDTILSSKEQILALEIIKLLDNKVIRNHYSELGKKRSKDFDAQKIIYDWMKILE